MESSIKPKLLYISQEVYKLFQEASNADWEKQVKAKTVKPFAPAADLFEKIEKADIVIYGTVLQKCDLGKGIVPDDIFNNFEDSHFWTRLLEKKEVEEIKKKCELENFTFTTKSKPRRKPKRTL